MSTIGLRVRLERNRLGLGLEQLAEHCGVSVQAQQDVENDKAAPDAVYLGLADQAGLDVVFVLTGQRRQASGEHQVLAGYRAADEQGRSALEAPDGAAGAQPGVAAAADQSAENSGVKLVVVIGLIVAAVLGVRACTARVDEQPQVRAAAPPIAYSPAQQASAAAALARDAQVLVQYSGAIVANIDKQLDRASKPALYSAMKDAHLRLFSLKLPELPPELRGNATARQVVDGVREVINARGGAMRHGMEFLDTRNPSEAAEYRERIDRAQQRSLEVRELLPKLAPGAASAPSP